MKISGNTILITGGGSGIGRALAQRWHDRGNDVIVTGRRRAMLDETVQGRPRMSAYDLDIDDTDAIKAFATKVVTEHPNLNVLVNNAGVFSLENLTAERDLSDAEKMVITDLLGPIRMTNSLIDHLKVQSAAVVVNVSSGLAFVPLPAGPTYSATKAALHSYTLSLRSQLKGKVEIIEIVPPQVQTELSPGQSTAEGCMPLNDFADEVMSLFEQQPTPGEICVEAVRYLRRAEAEGHFDQALAMLSASS